MGLHAVHDPLGRSHELIADRKQVLRPPSFLSVPATVRILEINSRLPNNSAQSLCHMIYHFTYIMLGEWSKFASSAAEWSQYFLLMMIKHYFPMECEKDGIQMHLLRVIRTMGWFVRKIAGAQLLKIKDPSFCWLPPAMLVTFYLLSQLEQNYRANCKCIKLLLNKIKKHPNQYCALSILRFRKASPWVSWSFASFFDF